MQRHWHRRVSFYAEPEKVSPFYDFGAVQLSMQDWSRGEKIEKHVHVVHFDVTRFDCGTFYFDPTHKSTAPHCSRFARFFIYSIVVFQAHDVLIGLTLFVLGTFRNIFSIPNPTSFHNYANRIIFIIIIILLFIFIRFRLSAKWNFSTSAW